MMRIRHFISPCLHMRIYSRNGSLEPPENTNLISRWRSIIVHGDGKAEGINGEKIHRNSSLMKYMESAIRDLNKACELGNKEACKRYNRVH